MESSFGDWVPEGFPRRSLGGREDEFPNEFTTPREMNDMFCNWLRPMKLEDREDAVIELKGMLDTHINYYMGRVCELGEQLQTDDVVELRR